MAQQYSFANVNNNNINKLYLEREDHLVHRSNLQWTLFTHMQWYNDLNMYKTNGKI